MHFVFQRPAASHHEKLPPAAATVESWGFFFALSPVSLNLFQHGVKWDKVGLSPLESWPGQQLMNKWNCPRAMAKRANRKCAFQMRAPCLISRLHLPAHVCMLVLMCGCQLVAIGSKFVPFTWSHLLVFRVCQCKAEIWFVFQFRVPEAEVVARMSNGSTPRTLCTKDYTLYVWLRS